MSTKITINTTGDIFIGTSGESPESKSVEGKVPPPFSIVVGIRKGDKDAPWNWLALHPDECDNNTLRRVFGEGPSLFRVEYTLTEVED